GTSGRGPTTAGRPEVPRCPSSLSMSSPSGGRPDRRSPPPFGVEGAAPERLVEQVEHLLLELRVALEGLEVEAVELVLAQEPVVHAEPLVRVHLEAARVDLGGRGVVAGLALHAGRHLDLAGVGVHDLTEAAADGGVVLGDEVDVVAVLVDEGG